MRIGGVGRIAVLAGWLWFLRIGPAAAQGVREGPPFPRLASVYLHGAVTPADIPVLSRWDVLVLDSVWSRAELQQLRQRNPNIRLYFYMCAYCMNVDPLPSDTWRRDNFVYAQAHDLWWRNTDGSIASDWPGVRLLNLTDRAPVGPEGSWRKWFAKRVEGFVTRYSELDGIFLDNFWRGIGWEQGTTIRVDSDCNPTHNPAGCDGVADSPALVDSLWNHALRDLARDVRGRLDGVEKRRGDRRPVAILTNGASDYFSWVNGTMYEGFPSRRTPADPGNSLRYNWNHDMFQAPGGYLVAPFSSRPYTVQIVNSNWTGTWTAPDRTEEFERHKRFTLVSTLLGDGYYSLDASHGHGSLWWEPEYDGGGLGKGYLGYPLGPARRILAPTGEEMVVNGTFVATQLPWTTRAVGCTGVYRMDQVDSHSAPTAARLEMSDVSSGGSLQLRQAVPIIGGRPFTLRFWARATQPREVLVRLSSDLCPGGRCLNDQRFWITKNWQEFVVSFVATGNAQAGLEFCLTEPGVVWIDDVSLRMGDSAVFRRDFERGIVLLNYTQTAQTVDLHGTFYRLRVPGSSVWDGAVLNAEILPPSDGRILLRDSRPTDVPDPEPSRAPRGALLHGSNPFTPGSSIRFSIGRDEHVQLIIYDVAGRRIRTLLDQPMQAGGDQAVPWDGTDDQGRRVPRGVYVCRIVTPSFTGSQKLTIVM